MLVNVKDACTCSVIKSWSIASASSAELPCVLEFLGSLPSRPLSVSFTHSSEIPTLELDCGLFLREDPEPPGVASEASSEESISNPMTTALIGCFSETE